MAGPASRRAFLKAGLLAAGGAGLGWAALQWLGRPGLVPVPHPAAGPLRAVADQTSGLPLLMLPEGFRYHTLAWAGSELGDGYPGPNRCDGMGVVGARDTRITLVRNHERRGSDGPIGDPATAWDVTGGGTTTLVFDTRDERLVDSRISLNGTLNNCAGGVTPWGTWLSCEEAPYTPELAHHGLETRQRHWDHGKARRPHGFVYEVHAAGERSPRPIEAMGQFYHEAAAIDARTGIVYMTEDRTPAAGLYRYLPEVPGQLLAGGRLQMLRVPGRPALDREVPLQSEFPVEWVDIPEPGRGHTPGTHDGQGVVRQGLAAGASAFIALEGCALREGRLYFTSKYGGAAQAGYIFELDVDRQALRLIFEAPARNGFSGPDNLVFSPGGTLVVCEDRVGLRTAGQYLVALTPDAELFALCRVNPDLRGQYLGHPLRDTALSSEWAGVCFSPDGAWMFANLYAPGVTFAITGPWPPGLV